VIGFGNPDREDDGVAFHVIGILRQRIGLSPAENLLESSLPSGEEIDPVFAGRLAPEHLFIASRYARMVFVDAHLPSFPEKIRFERIDPGKGSNPLTHQFSPGTFLAWVKAIYGNAPEGYLLSVKAHRFDFSPRLTEATRALVDPAVDVIMAFLTRDDPT
jgi:hydrogenase maturation protease